MVFFDGNWGVATCAIVTFARRQGHGGGSFMQFHTLRPSLRTAFASLLSAVINIGLDSPVKLEKKPFLSA